MNRKFSLIGIMKICPCRFYATKHDGNGNDGPSAATTTATIPAGPNAHQFAQTAAATAAATTTTTNGAATAAGTGGRAKSGANVVGFQFQFEQWRRGGGGQSGWLMDEKEMDTLSCMRSLIFFFFFILRLFYMCWSFILAPKSPLNHRVSSSTQF